MESFRNFLTSKFLLEDFKENVGFCNNLIKSGRFLKKKEKWWLFFIEILTKNVINV